MQRKAPFACKGGHLTAWHLADVLDHCERMRALRQEALVAGVDDDSDREPVDDGRCKWLLGGEVLAHINLSSLCSARML